MLSKAIQNYPELSVSAGEENLSLVAPRAQAIQPGLSRAVRGHQENSPKLSRAIQSYAKLSKTVQNYPKLSKTI